ncbi:hypothetical protein SAMN04487934_12226 [Eubacterium ruminantium]|nr:hypothetical protein SAMN04487934_12226 [Eubacterium ruminantium]
MHPANVGLKWFMSDEALDITLRDYFFIDGEYEGRMYYSILKESQF